MNKLRNNNELLNFRFFSSSRSGKFTFARIKDLFHYKSHYCLDHIIIILITIITFLFISPTCYAQEEEISADSIMTEVLRRAELYSQYIKEYEANTYIKGTSHVLKKNFLYRFAPDFLALDTKHDNTILEALIDINYQAPNKFSQNIKVVNGNTLNKEDLERVMRFININIYNPTSFNDEVLMPMTKNTFSYYQFTYEGSRDSLGYKILKIKTVSKLESQKLVTGYIYIVDQLYTVAGIDLSGHWDFLTFNIKTRFGIIEKEFLLPLQTDLVFELRLLGNRVINYYTSHSKYINIKKYESKSQQKKIEYDLTEYYKIKMDSLLVIKDSIFWDERRPVPLTMKEDSIYQSEKKKEKGISKIDSLKLKSNKNWNLTKGLIVPKRFTQGDTYFRYSGLLNPFKFGYSRSDGIVYWQQLKLKKINKSTGKELNFNPEIGFVFKHSEIYFKTPVNYLYKPEKMGSIDLEFGNRNQSYNSAMIDRIEEMLNEPNFNFDSLGLKYYKHYYLKLNNCYEICNGLKLDLGIDYHFYDAVKESKSNDSELRYNIMTADDELDNFFRYHRSFTPRIALTWTPHQYYQINGKKKEYLWSDYPTFSFEYAKSIKGVFKSSGKYERLEADVQQKIPLGSLRSFQYYAGAGVFTNTNAVYFADFQNFTKRNFPESWDDGIGGVFQLLDGHWYNASHSYIQLHMMYESPLLIMQFFKRAGRDIFKERFYVSQLYTPTLKSYSELGYGFGNFIFNTGIFINFKEGKFNELGFKFVFEL